MDTGPRLRGQHAGDLIVTVRHLPLVTRKPKLNPLIIFGHVIRGVGLPYEDGLFSRHNRDFL